MEKIFKTEEELRLYPTLRSSVHHESDIYISDDEIEMIRDLYWKGMSIRELAKKTDTAKSTLLNKRDRILAKLRKALEEK